VDISLPVVAASPAHTACNYQNFVAVEGKFAKLILSIKMNLLFPGMCLSSQLFDCTLTTLIITAVEQ
jgi:hypothetical protein